MARRKEVFQSKVLQKLYPAAPTLEKEKSSSCTVETLAKKTCVKRKPSQNDAGDVGKTQCGAGAGRRMYTVLPPPADYKADPEKFGALPEPEAMKNGEDAAEQSDHDSSEESGQDQEEEVGEQRKRRRRRRKAALHQRCGEGAGPGSESSTGQGQTPVDGAGERISKNKKRKLKKKRHKEKLLSMGLVPRAAALEFTYEKDGEEEEENNEERAAEVSDFLKTTMEIYKSDSSLRDSAELTALSATLDDLLSSLASGRRPASVLQRLHRLKVCTQRRQTDKLEEALEELSHASLLSAEETSAVVSLFQYWITDILPMQGDEKMELSASHP